MGIWRLSTMSLSPSLGRDDWFGAGLASRHVDYEFNGAQKVTQVASYNVSFTFETRKTRIFTAFSTRLMIQQVALCWYQTGAREWSACSRLTQHALLVHKLFVIWEPRKQLSYQLIWLIIQFFFATVPNATRDWERPWQTTPVGSQKKTCSPFSIATADRKKERHQCFQIGLNESRHLRSSVREFRVHQYSTSDRLHEDSKLPMNIFKLKCAIQSPRNKTKKYFNETSTFQTFDFGARADNFDDWRARKKFQKWITNRKLDWIWNRNVFRSL